MPSTDPIFFEIDPDCPDLAIVQEAGRRLRLGGIVAHQSDTVYGFAAAARHPEAVARIRDLKGAASDRPLIVLIDEPARIDALIHSIQRYAVDYIATFWPGPLTLIFNARPNTPCRASDGSVALRCPAQALTHSLVRECAGLLASTSANRGGESPLLSAREIQLTFGDALAMILADPNERANLSAVAFTKDGPPVQSPASPSTSTIVDCRGEEPVLIREGKISARELKL